MEWIVESIMDCLKMLPFLFAAFACMEAVEHYSGNKMNQMLEKAMQLTKNAAFVYKFVDCHELFVINQRFPYSSGLCYGVDYGLPWFER